MKKAILFLATFPLLFGCAGMKNIDIVVDFPETVKVDEEFEITISVTNLANEVQSLYAVNIPNSYLDGIEIFGTTPIYLDSYDVDVDETCSYSYETRIAPHETLTVKFICKAVLQGDYAGKMEICINTANNFKSIPLHTKII